MKSIPYVKLEYREAVDAKKELLSSQADILKTLKLIQNYKNLRKKELIKKSKIRLKLAQLKKDMNKFSIILPETQETREFEIKEREVIGEISKNKSIDAELKEIQRKLAELGKH